jgi:phosphoenolpyruvate carboxykinase (GTP)
VPTAGSLDTTGLDISADTLARLLAVDQEMWRQEVPQIEEHYANLGERVPTALRDQLAALEKRLAS